MRSCCPPIQPTSAAHAACTCSFSIQVDLLAREQALQHVLVRVLSAGIVQLESIIVDDSFLSCDGFQCWKQGWARQVLQDAVTAAARPAESRSVRLGLRMHSIQSSTHYHVLLHPSGSLAKSASSWAVVICAPPSLSSMQSLKEHTYIK